MSDIFDNLQLDDLEGSQREVAEVVGIENYRKLVREFGGTYIYIPEHDGFKASIRNETIRNEFDGYNFKELARKYSLSESAIRNIVGELREKVRNAPLPDQEKFF